MWTGSFSSSCTDNNVIGDVFMEFSKSFYRTADGDRMRTIDPIVREDWVRTGFKNSDGWTMEKYVGSRWSMTAYSRWFEEGGNGYTVQVRSNEYLKRGILSQENYYESSYDIILYDESGKRLASIEENECLEKLQGKYSERQYLHIMKGALQAIRGGDVEIKVTRPTGWMWIRQEVELDELTRS